MPPTRQVLPETPPKPGETGWQRYRRKQRRRLVRLFDRVILSLYRTAARLDRIAPPEKRYYRVAIFGSSRIKTFWTGGRDAYQPRTEKS